MLENKSQESGTDYSHQEGKDNKCGWEEWEEWSPPTSSCGLAKRARVRLCKCGQNQCREGNDKDMQTIMQTECGLENIREGMTSFSLNMNEKVLQGLALFLALFLCSLWIIHNYG